MATLEVCVDTADDLATAIAAGVDRIELCSALELGGLTPTPGLIAQARNAPTPIYAMIRPRAGGFMYSPAEVASMISDILAMRNAGFAGVVFGALTRDNALDVPTLRRLSNAATGLGVTLHKAIDDVPSPHNVVGMARDLGFERILSSGGANTAFDGRVELTAMLHHADNTIEIMAGGGVSFRNIDPLHAAGITSFHGSCKGAKAVDGKVGLDADVLRKTLRAIRQL